MPYKDELSRGTTLFPLSGLFIAVTGNPVGFLAAYQATFSRSSEVIASSTPVCTYYLVLSTCASFNIQQKKDLARGLQILSTPDDQSSGGGIGNKIQWPSSAESARGSFSNEYTIACGIFLLVI